MASVRVTYTISEESKKNMDKFKKEHKLNISDAIDKLLKLNDDSFNQLIKLMAMKKDKEEVTVDNKEVYCTNNKANIENIRMLVSNNTSIYEEINNQNNRVNEKIINIEKDIDVNSLEYKVNKLESQLSDAQKNINNLTRVTAKLLNESKKI